MTSRIHPGLRIALLGLVIGASALAPSAQAFADSQQQWVKGPLGRLYPADGWKNCAEAMAHAATPVFKGDIGYNPTLDPEGKGIECL